MTPTERERIEKDAHEYAQKIASELDENAGKTLLKIYAIADYTAGATAEHDKARNQAIDACKQILKNQTLDRGIIVTVDDILNQMEDLKNETI